MKKTFVRNLLDSLHKETMCNIQYNGCPCNICFHTWAEDELKLDSDFAHLFWLVTLALRGDCAQSELKKSNEDFFKEMIK